MDAEADKNIDSHTLTEERTRVRLSLFDCNIELARMIAKSLYKRRLGSDVEFHDYLHYAFAGLLEAIDRYDSTAGASFKTFASYRIRGSVINGLKSFSEHREQLSFLHVLNRERLESLSREVRSSSQDSLFEEMVELTLGLAIGFILEEKYVVCVEAVSPSDFVHAKYVAFR